MDTDYGYTDEQIMDCIDLVVSSHLHLFLFRQAAGYGPP